MRSIASISRFCLRFAPLVLLVVTLAVVLSASAAAQRDRAARKSPASPPTSLATRVVSDTGVQPGFQYGGSPWKALLDDTITPGGPPVNVNVTSPNGSVDLTFSGTAGERVFVQVTNVNITGFEVVSLLDTGGGTLRGSGVVTNSTNPNFLDTASLLTSGTYTIRTELFGGGTGSSTITLYDVPADASGPITPGGASVTAVTSSIGQNAAYTFTGTMGQRVALNIAGVSFTSGDYEIVTIFAPGQTVGPNQTGIAGSGVVGAGQHSFIDTIQLPSNGTYTVFVDPHGVATASSTTLTLYDVPPDPGPPITLNGAAVPVTLGTAGQNAYLPFQGWAGEPVKVSWPDSTFSSYQVRFLKADKQTSVSGTPLIGNPSFSWTATLPTDGTYYVQVDPYQDSTGSMTLSLTLDSPFVSLQQTFGTCDGRGINALTVSVCTADPVNSLTGAFTTSQTDLTLSGIGVRFAFTRSYTSADTTSGRLGPGWTDNFAASLAVQANGDVLVHGDEGQEVYYAKQPDGSFVGAGGALSTLTLVSGTYKLVTHDQVTYQFNSSGVLQSELDRNGQGLTFSYDGQGRLSTITDSVNRSISLNYNGSLLSSISVPDGRQVLYGYTNGRLTSVTLPDPDGAGPLTSPVWNYTYDAGGRLWQEIDPNNHTQVTNVYDPTSGRVTQQTDAKNKTTTFAWDAPTQTATITDADNHVWKDVYVNNVLNKRIDPGGDTTTFGHDTSLNTTSVQSPNGTDTISMSYQNGNLVTTTPPASLGSVPKTFTYDTQNNVRTVTDARNKQTVYGYDANGNNNSITLDTQPVFGATYNAQGQMLTSTDGNQKQTTYTYDTAGNVASVTAPDPDGPGPLAPSKTTYTYDAMGNVLTKVDPLGNCSGCNAANYTTTYTYDADGRLLTESDPLGHTTTYTYDAAGNQLTVKDANNHITTNSYDNANHLIQVTAPDPDGSGPLEAPVTKYTYDDVGNRVTMIDPLGNCSGCNAAAHTTTYGYDQNNRLASVTTPKGEKTTYTYDANGNLATVVDPRGNVTGCGCAAQYTTTYTYDAAGRLLTTTDPLSHTTTKHYDAVGNVDWTKDANQHQTNFTYDAAGRVLTIQAPDGGLTTNTYDGNGNLKTRKDDNNHQVTYTYDDAGRLIQVTGPNPGSGAPVTSYTYDLNGNLASMTDPNGNATQTQGDGTTTYTHDRANRLTNVGYSDSTPAVGFGYDNVGNRTSMTDGSGSVSYVYDNLDRLTSVTRGTNTFSYTYDGNGNTLTRTYPDNTQISYSYNEDNRLTSVTSGGVTTSYQYDPAGHLTTTTLPSGNGYVETRSYDNAGRLTEVKNVKGGTTLSDFVSTLDPVGNATQIVQSGVVSSTQTYTYDANDRILSVCFQAGTCPRSSDPFIRWTYDKVGNRLTEARPTGTTSYSYNALDELTQAGSTAYTYDANGNERTAGSTTLTYDLANRLKTHASGSTTTTYSYDGDGNRLQASTGSQASKKTNYLWDMTFALPQVALERDGNNALLRRYVYGSRRISMFTGGATYYYHYDALGSMRNLTSSTGVAQWTDTYEPYGAIRTETKNNSAAPANFMKFAGEYNDPTGLYYLRARQYDPATGRLIQPDPISPTPEKPDASTYAYVGDRPTVMVDPSGMTLQPSDASEEAALLAASLDWDLPRYECTLRDPVYTYASTDAAANRGNRRCEGTFHSAGTTFISRETPPNAFSGPVTVAWALKFSYFVQEEILGPSLDLSAIITVNGLLINNYQPHNGYPSNYTFHGSIGTLQYVGRRQNGHLKVGDRLVMIFTEIGITGAIGTEFFTCVA